MEFKEIKEKCFGKTVEEIKNEITQVKNFFKTEVEMVKICIDAENCAREILEEDKNFTGLFIFNKRQMIMLYILKNLTNLELIPEDNSFEDYDIFFEKAVLELNSKAFLFSLIVEEIIKEKKDEVINELYETFNSGLPSVDEIKEIQTTIGEVFSKESPENLKTIENILAYNDPIMKQVKDIVTTNTTILNEKIESK